MILLLLYDATTTVIVVFLLLANNDTALDLSAAAKNKKEQALPVLPTAKRTTDGLSGGNNGQIASGIFTLTMTTAGHSYYDIL